MTSLAAQRQVGARDGLYSAQSVALNARRLDQSTDRITSQSQIMLNADLRSLLDGLWTGAHASCEGAGGHGARDADFSHAATFSGGDGGAAFVEHADSGGGKEESGNVALGVVADEFEDVLEDSGDNARGTVGWGCDDATASSVSFVDGHGVHGQMVHSWEAGAAGRRGRDGVGEGTVDAEGDTVDMLAG